MFSGNRVVDARELEGLEPYILHNTRAEAEDNFGQEYNGLSIRMKGEIATKFYKTTVDGVTQYGYTTPYTGGPDTGQVEPNNAGAIPKGGSFVGDGHTHANDRAKQFKLNGVIYGDDDNKPSEQDVNRSKKEAKNSTTYEYDIVITGDGSKFYYGPNTDEDNVKPTSTNMPSDPRSPVRKNKVSPNNSPQVLPLSGGEPGSFKDIYPAIPNDMPKPPLPNKPPQN